ncbi:MAG: biopolymer transporter ExbD [Candidatus Latescibacterota bacterium]
MRRRRRQPARLESSINVTPMGDVSLSLLLGFLVITPVILETLSAVLAQGGGAASGQLKQDPVVVLSAEGKVSIDGRDVTREELPARLREVFPPGTAGEHKVLFTGAGQVPYHEVVALLDLLKENGVETIGIR